MSSSETGLSASGSALGPQDNRPLTEQEFQLLQRLLADPFSFPIEFKTWLVAYLSASDLTLPISAILGLSNLLGITGAGGGALGILPAGIILPFGGDVAPRGALLCDGASYSKSEQARLWTAIGARFGSIDGTHFNVPDFRGRAPVGTGTHADVNAIGKTETPALPLGQRTPKHDSSVSDPGHGHSATVSDPGHRHFAPTVGTVGGDFGGTSPLPYSRDLAYIDAATTGIGVSVNGNLTGIGVGPGGGRPVDQPAFVTINFIIIN
jgi:microcystin-dependent protein